MEYIGIYTLFICGLLALALVCFFLHKKVKKLERENKNKDDAYNSLSNRMKDMHLNQLNPHLLKNSLSAILSHSYQTYYTMDKLAQVLDYVLYESPQKFVSPKSEIKFALDLIEVNRVKVSPLFDINVRVLVDEDEPLYTKDVLVPLIAIDLIENAFKHADFQSLNGFISLVLEFRRSCFKVTVKNKISKKSPLLKSKSGIGSKSLEERLLLYYPGQFELKRFAEDDTYYAYLKITLHE